MSPLASVVWRNRSYPPRCSLSLNTNTNDWKYFSLACCCGFRSKARTRWTLHPYTTQKDESSSGLMGQGEYYSCTLWTLFPYAMQKIIKQKGRKFFWLVTAIEDQRLGQEHCFHTQCKLREVLTFSCSPKAGTRRTQHHERKMKVLLTCNYS